MDMNQLEELYLRRQSCRSFNAEKPVSDELLAKICNLACLSPSACNAQPWKLAVVTGEKTKEIAKSVQGLGMNKFASDVPAFIAIIEGKSNLTAKLGSRIKDNEFTQNDVGMMVAHLVLAAESAGLATCILGWRNEEKLREILGLKEKERVPLVVAVGYATDGYDIRPKKRKPTEETVTFIR